MLENLNAGENSICAWRRMQLTHVLTGAKARSYEWSFGYHSRVVVRRKMKLKKLTNGAYLWFKRIRHTQDHPQVTQLKEGLGLQ